MKLNEVFRSTGKPFLYYPGIVHRFGVSVNASIFLGYVGWETLPEEPDEWFECNAVDITKATGLTTREQEAARKALVGAGLLEEHYARLEHKLRFRLSGKELGLRNDNGESPNAENADAPLEHTRKARMTRREERGSSLDKSLIRGEAKEGADASAIASEPKTQKLPPIPASLNSPKFQTAWAGWIADRKERKKAVTFRAAEMQLEKLRLWGHSKAISAIEASIANGWQGLFEPKEEVETNNYRRRPVYDDNPLNISGLSL